MGFAGSMARSPDSVCIVCGAKISVMVRTCPRRHHDKRYITYSTYNKQSVLYNYYTHVNKSTIIIRGSDLDKGFSALECLHVWSGYMRYADGVDSP